MSIGDYLILAVIAAAIFLAVRHIRRHKHSCAGGCSGCPHAGSCRHSATPPDACSSAIGDSFAANGNCSPAIGESFAANGNCSPAIGDSSGANDESSLENGKSSPAIGDSSDAND